MSYKSKALVSPYRGLGSKDKQQSDRVLGYHCRATPVQGEPEEAFSEFAAAWGLGCVG